ncbi:DUF550 domain-containing protein [Klebsiella aerogenes]
MTKSTITRERAEQLANFKGAPVTRQEEQELARIALAAMDSEPVAYAWVSRSGKKYLTRCEPEQWRDAVILTPLYRHAQPAPERDQVRSEHAEWSQATFGNVGPVGPLKHLSKEALEAAADPGDLSEWADMQFLLWDAQRRAGITDEQITQAMIEKLVVNKQREWPDPKDGEPRLHIKAQQAPVAPEEMTPQQASRSYGGEVRGYRDGWNACRAAMLQAEPVTTANKLGNSPVIPDGYVMVPKEPTEEMNKAGWAAMNEHYAINPTYRAMLAAAPQEVNHG